MNILHAKDVEKKLFIKEVGLDLVTKDEQGLPDKGKVEKYWVGFSSPSRPLVCKESSLLLVDDLGTE